MKREALLIKTAFACMACDGSIDPKEMKLVREYACEDGICNEETLDEELEKLAEEFNEDSNEFMRGYFDSLQAATLSAEEQLDIIRYAIDIIRSDEYIDYREIRFFKTIRSYLPISDEDILSRMDDIEDYLQRDIGDRTTRSNPMEAFLDSFDTKHVDL